MMQHNSGYFKNSFTSAANDWELEVKIPFKSRQNARAAEVLLRR
jgi:hypothetical protein